MQVMPHSPFLPSLLHRQFLARGLGGAGAGPIPVSDPTTPPSSEDNMSPPPRIDGDMIQETQDNYDREKEFKRDFKCPLCSENMTSLKEFTSHLRGHNEVKPTPDPSDPTGQTKVYHCCLCGKMLSSFSSLDRHMLVHSGERPFSCEVCGQTFTTNGNMHRHRRTHNVRDSCESDCSAGSAGKKGRKRKAISAMMSPIDKLANMQHDDIQQSAYAPLKCPICSEHFFSDISLDVHVISIHPGKEIRCEDCSHPCPSYNYYKLHRNMFHFKASSLGSPFPPIPHATPQLSPYNATPAHHLLSQGNHQDQNVQLPVIPPPTLSPVKRETIEVKKEPLCSPALSTTADFLNTSFCSDNGGGLQDDDPVLKECKLKGEFPCRLCPAKFPNLRALKGHNKEHLLTIPFECNVGTCQYYSSDKSVLLQHMRAHTGQKPFECRICSFGFTTKANCERHVKNKHNKNAKEDVRDHIIIHEGDDESNSYISERDGSGFLSSRQDPSSFIESDCKNSATTIFPPTPPRNSAFIPYRPFDIFERNDEEDVKCEDNEEAPLDLSKATKSIDKNISTSLKKPCDLSNLADAANANNNLSPYLETMSKKTPIMGATDSMPSFANAPRFPFGLPFLPQGSPAAPIWPPGLGMNPATVGFPFNPMHLAALLAAKNEEFKKQAEAIQAKETAAALRSLNQMQELASLNQHSHHLVNQISPPLSTVSPQNSPNKQSAVTPSGCDNGELNYKMVIKNGILMRKQKQRRYRTERPYGCDQCSARFTLRSNMDRHMKQQHPETYSLKPRSGPGRKPAFQDDELVSTGPPNAKEEDLELIRNENSREKDGFETEEEEGFLDEEDEEDEQNLIIDDTKQQSNGDHTFSNISNYFDKDGFRLDNEDDDFLEEGSESSGGSHSDLEKKKSAYSAAPHKMSCPYCSRKFPWSSSLKRHILTHTGQKPFKCTECPLWFTTKSNCDRHILRKHGNNNNIISGELGEKEFNDNGDECCAGEDEDEEAGFTYTPLDLVADSREFPNRRESTSDFPYKCHICDEGFPERTVAVNHIESSHNEEYQSLLEKGAFENPEDVYHQPTPESGGEELYDQLRGKFPDYVNRKIICLFCSRKFWSAEDLRRHVRTHTGERPYSCDICSRRFTLKHSMLRHKKKHDSGLSSNGEGSDDDSLSNHSSSGDDNPSQKSNQIQPNNPHLFDQKRANLTNLMDKINRLNSTPEGQ